MDQKTGRLPTVRISSPTVPERRDPQSRERLRLRVRSEFDEGVLVLTLAAAARLFGIREDICIRVLGELQSEGVLYSSGERYATRSLFD
jgi:hypothetical protein